MNRQNLAVAALFLLSLLVWRWFDDSLRLPEEQPRRSSSRRSPPRT